jgi:hypothetical protein
MTRKNSDGNKGPRSKLKVGLNMAGGAVILAAIILDVLRNIAENTVEDARDKAKEIPSKYSVRKR